MSHLDKRKNKKLRDSNADDLQIASTIKRSRKCTNLYGDNAMRDYNRFFDMATPDEEPVVLNSVEITSKVPTPLDCITSEPVEDISSSLAAMSTTIKYLNEKVNRLTDEIRRMRNDTTLQIDSFDVKAEEMNLLRKFESFELPIQNSDQLEFLENDLKIDRSFYVFFVSEFSLIRLLLR